MNRNSFKKILFTTVLSVSLFSTTVLAATQSASFYFHNELVKGYLHPIWSATSRDIAWAETSIANAVSGHVTTTYVEGQNYSGTVLAKDFRTGTTYSTTNNIGATSVWRFNSTHGMASSTDVYTTIASALCSDW